MKTVKIFTLKMMIQLKKLTEVNGISAFMKMGRGLQDLAFYVSVSWEPFLETDFDSIAVKNEEGWFSVSGDSVGLGRLRLNSLLRQRLPV